MKKVFLILTMAALGFVSCKKGGDGGDDGGKGAQPTVKIEVSDIADNGATVSAALETGSFHGAKVVTGIRVSTLTFDYTKEIQLIQYVEQNGETVTSMPYGKQLENLIFDQDYFCAIIVYDSTGRACDSDYETFTAQGDPEGISNDNSAGNLEDNPQ